MKQGKQKNRVNKKCETLSRMKNFALKKQQIPFFDHAPMSLFCGAVWGVAPKCQNSQHNDIKTSEYHHKLRTDGPDREPFKLLMIRLNRILKI